MGAESSGVPSPFESAEPSDMRAPDPLLPRYHRAASSISAQLGAGGGDDIVARIHHACALGDEPHNELVRALQLVVEPPCARDAAACFVYTALSPAASAAACSRFCGTARRGQGVRLRRVEAIELCKSRARGVAYRRLAASAQKQLVAP